MNVSNIGNLSNYTDHRTRSSDKSAGAESACTTKNLSHRFSDLSQQQREEFEENLKNGTTDPTFQLGAGTYTQKEFDRLLKKVDDAIEVMKQENEKVKEEIKENKQEEAIQKRLDNEEFLQEADDEKKRLALLQERKQAYEAQLMWDAGSADCSLADRLSDKESAPYSYLAKDGIIDYEGVIFVCDEEHNRICLGDVSNPKNCLNIALSGGGSLLVNRENLGELSKAIGMFSPEDVNLIMRAISQDTKVQQMQIELDEEKNSLGIRQFNE